MGWPERRSPAFSEAAPRLSLPTRWRPAAARYLAGPRRRKWCGSCRCPVPEGPEAPHCSPGAGLHSVAGQAQATQAVTRQVESTLQASIPHLRHALSKLLSSAAANISVLSGCRADQGRAVQQGGK